ncbi:MAG: IS66 family insertion sequence element accessory protein TnpA [Armatimonadota bacterium]
MPGGYNPELLKEWEGHIEEYRASGLSTRKWCEENGISQHKLRYWLERSREWREEINWSRVEICDSESCGDGISVRVGAARIEVRVGFNHDLLCEVLHVVMSAC